MLVEAKPMSTHTEEPKLMSYAEFRAMPEDGKRYELWDGVPVEMPPSPRANHQRAIANLLQALKNWADVHAGVEVFVAPMDLLLRRQPKTLVLQPDLMVLLPGGKAQVGVEGVEGGPAVVVEVLSPSTARKDRVHKLRRYAEAGVQSYWLVDVDLQCVERLTLSTQGHTLEGHAFADDECLVDPLLPGFALPLPRLFAGMGPVESL